MSYSDSTGGRTRPKLDAFRPGHIFLMPKGSTWLNPDKPRPYVLATGCNSDDFGTLVYGSTQETERAASAAFVEVAPRPLGVNANGLRSRTLFYPGLLYPSKYETLPPHLGHLGPLLAGLRRALRTALGIGSGTCRHPSAPGGSRRGRIVLLDPSFKPAFHTRHAVVLTEHVYSREERYQVIVPIVHGAPKESNDANSLCVPWQHWFGVFTQPTSEVHFVLPVIQSVWHYDDIADETPYVIDEGSLERVEERLCAMFGIEERGE